jgi:mono/diheme cytochrome c family protein
MTRQVAGLSRQEFAMRRISVVLAGIALSACASQGAPAPDSAGPAGVAGPTRAEVGHRLADRLCARCHQVGAEGDSPNAGAPPFKVLAARYSEVTLGRKLDDIAIGHYDMPPTHVTNDEIDSLSAYLESFRGD